MTHNVQKRKKANVKIISSLVIISLLSILVFTAIPVSACHYTLDTFESDYTTPKDSFLKGEVVYGLGKAYGYYYPMQLRIRDPAGNVVYYSEESTNVVYGSYLLDDTAPVGTWNIQLGVNISGNVQWSTSSGRIAYFTVADANFMLTVNIDGNGSVVKNPDQDYYSYGSSVDLTANADPGWSFSHFSGDISSSDNPVSIIMDAHKTVTAHFIQEQYTLNVTIDGLGNVSINPDKPFYLYGDLVELSADPEEGWIFNQWTGDIASTENPLTIMIDDNKNITAVFTEPLYTLNIEIVGNGDVDIDKPGPYHHGETVTLTATASAGSTFSHWSNDLTGNENPINITMDSDKSVTANFIENEYILTIIVIGNGSVVVDPEEDSYKNGSLVNLTAIAEPGYSFSHYSGDIVSTNKTENITINSNKTVTAHFTQDQYNLTINIQGSGSVEKTPNQESYTYNTSVELTASPASDYVFDYWSGDITGDANPIIINMTSDKNITAHFKEANTDPGPTDPGPKNPSTPKPNKSPVADLSAGEPYIAFINEEIKFNGSKSYDYDGQIVKYEWDYGNGNTGDGEITAYTYTIPGDYTVKLKVTDNRDGSDTDEAIAVIIKPNHPSSKPNITGPSEGITNEEYEFVIVSTDEDGDKIRYTIDWGDNSSNQSDFLDSGEEFKITHKWAEPGNYTIKATADDSESPSTEDFTITIDDPDDEDIPEDFNLVLLLLLLFLIMLILILLAEKKRRKKKEELKEEEK